MAVDTYPVGFYFELSFDGEDAAFQEVSGISKETSLEEVACGGENRFKYRLPTITTSKNLILKRALVQRNSKLINWCVYTLDKGLAFKINTKDVSVNLLNKDGYVSSQWTFYGAYPVKYAISDLKSDENKIVLQTIELAYSYFEIPNKYS